MISNFLLLVEYPSILIGFPSTLNFYLLLCNTPENWMKFSLESPWFSI